MASEPRSLPRLRSPRSAAAAAAAPLLPLLLAGLCPPLAGGARLSSERGVPSISIGGDRIFSLEEIGQAGFDVDAMVDMMDSKIAQLRGIWGVADGAGFGELNLMPRLRFSRASQHWSNWWEGAWDVKVEWLEDVPQECMDEEGSVTDPMVATPLFHMHNDFVRSMVLQWHCGGCRCQVSVLQNSPGQLWMSVFAGEGGPGENADRRQPPRGYPLWMDERFVLQEAADTDDDGEDSELDGVSDEASDAAMALRLGDSRPLVIVDMDETLCRYSEAFVRWHAAKAGHPKAPLPDVGTCFEIANSDLHEQDRGEFARSAKSLQMARVPGAFEALESLKKAGLRVVAMTSRSRYFARRMRSHVAHFFPGLVDDVVFVLPDDTGEACKRMGAAVFVGATPRDAVDASEAGVPAVQFDLDGTYTWISTLWVEILRVKEIVQLRSWGAIVSHIFRELELPEEAVLRAGRSSSSSSEGGSSSRSIGSQSAAGAGREGGDGGAGGDDDEEEEEEEEQDEDEGEDEDEEEDDDGSVEEDPSTEEYMGDEDLDDDEEEEETDDVADDFSEGNDDDNGDDNADDDDGEEEEDEGGDRETSALARR